jgi:hypothetical protein
MISPNKHANPFGRKMFILGAAVILPFNQALAQDRQQVSLSAIEQDANKWSTLHLNWKLDDGWLAGIGIHNRVSDGVSTFRRMRYRLLAGKRISENTTLQVGLDRIENYSPNNHEDRTWQQYEYSFPQWGRLSLSFRTRVEQRFIQGVSGPIVRSRHMISGTYPIGAAEKWYAVGWQELFINWNRQQEWPQGWFAQNRLFGGLGYHVNAQNRFELGYQGRYMELDDRPQRLDHILFLQWFHDF